MLTLTRAKHRPIICIETKYEENGWILKRERDGECVRESQGERGRERDGECV